MMVTELGLLFVGNLTYIVPLPLSLERLGALSLSLLRGVVVVVIAVLHIGVGVVSKAGPAIAIAIAIDMAMAAAKAPAPAARSSFDFPCLLAPYLPSPSTDDEAEEGEDEDIVDDVDTSFLAEDSFDSLDEWSDDRPDSSEDSDRSSDSDDCSAAWTPKSKKHSPHPHLHKKSSFHSACDYLSFFGALRKGFCSRPLDQRIAASKIRKRADKATLPGGGESAQPEQKCVAKAGVGDGRAVASRNRHSAASNLEDREGAVAFSAMFKCTAADTPKILFKRANPSEDADEQDINALEAGAENRAEKDLTESDKKFRKRTARINVAMVLECDGKDSSKKSTDGPRSKEEICKDMTHKEYGESHVESGNCVSRTNPVPSKSRLLDENLNLKEVDKSRKLNKTSETQNCWRGSDNEKMHNKSDSKPAMADRSNKSSKIPNQVAMTVNKLESQEKDCISIPLCKDLQEKNPSSSDKLNEAVDVPTVLVNSTAEEDKKLTQSEVSANKAKLQDMPLHIYIKEKHQPEMVAKDPKRRAKAKKVKASKGKKLHLFRDGFTLPSATEPAEDAESVPTVLDKQSEPNNKFQSIKTVVKNQMLKEVLSTSATESDIKPPVIVEIENVTRLPGSIPGNALEVVDGVPLRDSTEAVATLKFIKTQVGNPIVNDSDQSGVALSGSVPKGVLPLSASYQNMEEGDASVTSFNEALHAAQTHPEAQTSGFSEESSMRTVITSVPPPAQVSSRGWFPRLDVELHDPVAAPELDTTLNGSLSVPGALVGNSHATSMLNYSSTTPSQELDPMSEDIQANLASFGNVDYSASHSSSFVEAPSTAYHLGKRVVPRAIVSSSLRISTMDTSNVQNSRFMQVPVSQNQAYAPNPVSKMSLQQEINPPASFHVDSRAPITSTWFQPGNSSGLGFSFPMAPTSTPSFGQVIGCNNQTLSMYKQMKSFSIDARYLVNVPSIVPGCCKLFLFNIESRQLYGVYVSSSLQAMPIDHEFPVAFDCMENYSLPLSVGELDTILPEAKQMDGRPLFLQSRMVEQLVTMFERKNKSRLSWVPSTTNPVSIAGVQELLELSAIASESSCTQDRIAEAMGQGYSVTSASAASLATNEVTKDSWSSLSSGSGGKVPESGQALVAHEPDSQLASARVFSFPGSSINDVEGAKSIWPEVSQTGFTRKIPEQGVAPSPMALWPHLFPKASSADTRKDSFMQMEIREGNSSQNYHSSLSEMIDMGARSDSESEVSFSSHPESLLRGNALRPKLAYNPLAVEQGRQRHLFDGPKPSSWSTLGTEFDLQQISQYGNRSNSQDNKFIAPLSSPPISEQLNGNISGAAPVESSSVELSELPSHYEIDHALPDSLRDDLGLSSTSTMQTTSAWNEEPHSMHLSTGPELVPGAVNLDQTNLCCYCFIRRADHLIIDCQHLGPCVECAAGKKIEYCGQLNCQTKVTRLLRLFRPV